MKACQKTLSSPLFGADLEKLFPSSCPAAASGILRYGIPGFKLEKRVIDRRLGQLVAEGVQFECCVHVGEDISAAYLRRSFDEAVMERKTAADA